jgi:hypothetical protein
LLRGFFIRFSGRETEGVIMAFKQAERTQLYLRCALFGPSGSGKTMTALRIAKGIADTMGVPFAVIGAFGVSLYGRLAGNEASPSSPILNQHKETGNQLIREIGQITTVKKGGRHAA